MRDSILSLGPPRGHAVPVARLDLNTKKLELDVDVAGPNRFDRLH